MNWKLMAAVAAVGVGIYVFAPWLARFVFPVLIVLAACPSSMLLMMRAMGITGSGRTSDEPGGSDEVARLRAEVAERGDGLAKHEAVGARRRTTRRCRKQVARVVTRGRSVAEAADEVGLGWRAAM